LRLPNVAGSFQMGNIITGDQNMRLIPTLENSIERGEEFKFIGNPKTTVGFIDFEDVAELIKRGLTYLFMGRESFVEDVYPKENYALKQLVAYAHGQRTEGGESGARQNPYFLENRLGWQSTRTFDDIWMQARKLAGAEKKYRPAIQVDFKQEALAMQEVYKAIQDRDFPLDKEDRMEALLGLLVYSMNSRTDLAANQKLNELKDLITRTFRRNLKGYDIDEKRNFIKPLMESDILSYLSEYTKEIDKDDVLSVQYKQYRKAIDHLWNLIRWSSDKAMITRSNQEPKTPGGIDLNGQHLQWDIHQDNSLNEKGNTALNNIDFNGIEPSILSITPLPRNYFTKYFAA
jgi:hypothetical protein